MGMGSPSYDPKNHIGDDSSGTWFCRYALKSAFQFSVRVGLHNVIHVALIFCMNDVIGSPPCGATRGRGRNWNGLCNESSIHNLEEKSFDELSGSIPFIAPKMFPAMTDMTLRNERAVICGCGMEEDENELEIKWGRDWVSTSVRCCYWPYHYEHFLLNISVSRISPINSLLCD